MMMTMIAAPAWHGIPDRNLTLPGGASLSVFDSRAVGIRPALPQPLPASPVVQSHPLCWLLQQQRLLHVWSSCARGQRRAYVSTRRSRDAPLPGASLWQRRAMACMADRTGEGVSMQRRDLHALSATVLCR